MHVYEFIVIFPTEYEYKNPFEAAQYTFCTLVIGSVCMHLPLRICVNKAEDGALLSNRTIIHYHWIMHDGEGGCQILEFHWFICVTCSVIIWESGIMQYI